MARFKVARFLDVAASHPISLYVPHTHVRILVRISLKERVYTFLKRGIYVYTVYVLSHRYTDTTDTRLSDPPSYEYIHLCYPDKAKEAVCALNIDFKRKPCYKTAVKKVRIRQTSNFLPPLPLPLFPILMENWKRADTMDWYGEESETSIGSAQRQVAS